MKLIFNQGLLHFAELKRVSLIHHFKIFRRSLEVILNIQSCQNLFA